MIVSNSSSPASTPPVTDQQRITRECQPFVDVLDATIKSRDITIIGAELFNAYEAMNAERCYADISNVVTNMLTGLKASGLRTLGLWLKDDYGDNVDRLIQDHARRDEPAGSERALKLAMAAADCGIKVIALRHPGIVLGDFNPALLNISANYMTGKIRPTLEEGKVLIIGSELELCRNPVALGTATIRPLLSNFPTRSSATFKFVEDSASDETVPTAIREYLLAEKKTPDNSFYCIPNLLTVSRRWGPLSSQADQVIFRRTGFAAQPLL